MSENQVLIEGVFYTPCKEPFIKLLHTNDATQQIHITPLYDEYNADWFQVIFENGDKRFIQSALWGWRFLDQVPEPETEESEDADADLELAMRVGEIIEAHYFIE